MHLKKRTNENVPRKKEARRATEQMIPITVFGAGAVGGVIASRLALSGFEVSIIAREATVAAVKNRGLKFISKDKKDDIIQLNAFTHLSEAIPLELVLVTTKAHSNYQASKQIRQSASEDTRVLLVQNGVGNSEEFGRNFDPNRIYRAITTIGSLVIEPGFVIESSTGKITVGKVPSLVAKEDWNFLEAISRIFNDSHIPTTISKEIIKPIWRKCLLNSALNPICAIMGITNGKVLADSKLERFFERIISEGQQVLERIGITFELIEIIAVAKEIVRNTSDNKCSMLQDLEKGKMTEIDFLNFQIVKQAKRAGISSPINNELVYLIKALEKGNITKKEAKNRLLLIINNEK